MKKRQNKINIGGKIKMTKAERRARSLKLLAKATRTAIELIGALILVFIAKPVLNEETWEKRITERMRRLEDIEEAINS